MQSLDALALFWRHAAVPLGGLFLFGAITVQLFSGQRGVWVWATLSTQVETLTEENHALSAQVVAYEDRVRRLSDAGGGVDVDYLDEMVRRTLPVLKSEEKILFLPPAHQG